VTVGAAWVPQGVTRLSGLLVSAAVRPVTVAAMGADVPVLADGGLSRGILDRAADRRADDAWWRQVLDDPATLAIPVSGPRFPLVTAPTVASPGDSAERDRPRAAWRPLAQAPDGPRYLLGVDLDGRARVAVHVREPEADWVNLREVGDGLDDLDVGALTHAVALVNWHDSHPFSARDGGPTRPAHAGAVRVDADGHEFYPRSDPAMIVLVRDGDDRALLGHQRVWPAGRYSCLAGFVEAGESLEQAVVREVREEAGLEVTEVSYAGSQPWPFPRSIMVGFFATAADSATTPDGEEITDLRWYSRDEMREQVHSRELRLPGRVSIARRLIEAWYGSELPYDW
jgi:NAD+ diphosphatase